MSKRNAAHLAVAEYSFDSSDPPNPQTRLLFQKKGVEDATENIVMEQLYYRCANR